MLPLEVELDLAGGHRATLLVLGGLVSEGPTVGSDLGLGTVEVLEDRFQPLNKGNRLRVGGI